MYIRRPETSRLRLRYRIGPTYAFVKHAWECTDTDNKHLCAFMDVTFTCMNGDVQRWPISWAGGLASFMRLRIRRPDRPALFTWHLCTNDYFSATQCLPLNSMWSTFFAAASATVACYPNSKLHRHTCQPGDLEIRQIHKVGRKREQREKRNLAYIFIYCFLGPQNHKTALNHCQ